MEAKALIGRARESIPPDGRLLLVSPHLDDAALSCAGLIARTEPIDVVNVFTGEPDPPRQGSWDQKTGFGSSAESWPARRAEDRAAFADTPHRVTLLDLLDRDYLEGPRSDADAAAIREAINDWAAEAGGGTVALPAGAGRWRGRLRAELARRIRPLNKNWPNPDHQFVRDAGLMAIAGRRDLTPLLYEELPYLWAGSADRAVAWAAAAWGRHVEPVVIEIDRAAKASRIGCYASQVPHLCADGTRLDVPEVLPPVERYWRLEEQRARPS